MATVVQGNAVIGTTGTSRGTSYASTPTSGNILFLYYGARDNANAQLPTFTMPSGWTKAVEVTNMEFHTAGIAWKISDGTAEGVVEVTADITCNSWLVGLVEANEPGVTDWVLDQIAENGSGATNVSSIASGSTGVLGSSVGIAAIVGTSRTASEGLSTDTGASLDPTDTDFQADAGSANFISAWLSLISTDAFDVTISESNGASRMGAAIATFIEDAGGATSVSVGVAAETEAAQPVLVVGGGTVVSVGAVSESETAQVTKATVPTSLYATLTQTIADVVNENDTTTDLHLSVDDDPASPDDNDWVNNAVDVT